MQTDPINRTSFQTKKILNRWYFSCKFCMTCSISDLLGCLGYPAWRSLNLNVVPEQTKFINTFKPSDNLTIGPSEGICANICPVIHLSMQMSAEASYIRWPVLRALRDSGR